MFVCACVHACGRACVCVCVGVCLTIDSVMSSSNTASSTTSWGQKQLPGHRKQEIVPYNRKYISLSLSHTHARTYTHIVCPAIDGQIAGSVQFLFQLWCCNTTRTTVGVSLHSTISNVPHTHTHTHTHTEITWWLLHLFPSLHLTSLSFITFFASPPSLAGSVCH